PPRPPAPGAFRVRSLSAPADLRFATSAYHNVNMSADLLQLTDAGLYCPQGRFFIDPWLSVERAVITHAHADHLRPGSRQYLVSPPGPGRPRTRLGNTAAVAGLPYGEELLVTGVAVSLPPAGHVLGSAQVRVEHGGQVWVVSGDYKLTADPTCTPFEPVRCH